MQKLLSALVAIMSFAGLLSGVGVSPATAQRLPVANGPETAAPDSAAVDGARPVVLRPGVIRDNVEVRDRPLIIEGDVKGSVHAVHSKITIMPGGILEGNMTLEGSSITVAPGAAGMLTGIAPRGGVSPSSTAPRSRKADWFGGQFCLWLLGIGAALVVMLAAPNATSRTADMVSIRPGRSLLAGLIVAAGMFSALAVSGAIMHTGSFMSMLWMPFLIVIALATLFLLVFGWLAGMRRAGDLVARRFGDTGGGSLFGRTVLGLTTFFLANSALGAINPSLGSVGLLVEFGVALMGVGAIVQTGMGRDDQWLSRKFGPTAGDNPG